ncbi:MAG: hypothetical protein HY648_00345 [Acidobacteria bacterium]|nr:hypothetical protein [Acidobacteriota bacterium]
MLLLFASGSLTTFALYVLNVVSAPIRNLPTEIKVSTGIALIALLTVAIGNIWRYVRYRKVEPNLAIHWVRFALWGETDEMENGEKIYADRPLLCLSYTFIPTKPMTISELLLEIGDQQIKPVQEAHGSSPVKAPFFLRKMGTHDIYFRLPRKFIGKDFKYRLAVKSNGHKYVSGRIDGSCGKN